MTTLTLPTIQGRWTLPLSSSTEFVESFEETDTIYSTDIKYQQEDSPSAQKTIFEYVRDSEILKQVNHWRIATQKGSSGQLDSENHSMSLLHLMTDSDGKPIPYALYIKEVFQYVSEQGISVSLAIQVISLIASISNLEKHNLHIYELEDSGLVLDFFLETERVSCVMREQYAHIMGMLGGELKEDILQGSDYSLEQVSYCLQQQLKAVFKIEEI